MAFEVNGHPIAEVRVERIAGQPALGFSRLILHLKLELRPRLQGQEACITDLTGDLLVQGRRGGLQHLGHLQPMNAPVLIEVGQHAWSSPATLEVELDRQRLEAIEQIRQGGDLTFTLTLRGRARVKPDTVCMLYEQLDYRVNQGTWAETLGQLAYARIMLLEVPVPDSQDEPELAQAIQHLTSAQQAMARGSYREAVGLCRDVLESLSLALGDRDDQDAAFQPLFANLRQMDKAARLRLVRRALKVLTHPARHVDDVTVRVDWDRADAAAVITMLAALLPVIAPSP